MNNLSIINKMTSMEIAEITGKQHQHVMRDIRDEAEKLSNAGIDTASKFGLREREGLIDNIPYYELTKEGVLQLAARYDAVTRAKLIELAMRQDKPKIPQTFAEALRLAADLEEERQKLLPKAEGYDYLMNASGTVTIGEAASIIGIRGIGQNKFFKLLATEEIIFKKGNSYVPYSDYKDRFIVKQNPIKMGDVIENRSQLYLDTKGLDWLAKLLARRGYEIRMSCA
jgi:phage antirepressor YoqD-like protein